MLGPRRMDARTAESPVISRQLSWLQRERASGRFYDRVAVLLGLFLVAMLALSFWLLQRGAEPGTLLSLPLSALLLIGILLPAIALMALYARKVALRRAEQGGLGSGRLHIRLVALFTADEEIGSPSSKELIMKEARSARAVFNSEPGRPGGGIVTGRKGGKFMRIEVIGKRRSSVFETLADWLPRHDGES